MDKGRDNFRKWFFAMSTTQEEVPSLEEANHKICRLEAHKADINACLRILADKK